MGDVPVEGKRIGEALIGNWDLDLTMEDRQSKQRMRVNPDLSGLWGTLPIEKIDLKDGKVNFKVKMEFGGQGSEMTFNGTLTDGKLTGQMTSDWGTQKAEGKKIVRTFRRGAGGGPQTNLYDFRLSRPAGFTVGRSFFALLLWPRFFSHCFGVKRLCFGVRRCFPCKHGTDEGKIFRPVREFLETGASFFICLRRRDGRVCYDHH
jgi:hypothetical protein